MKRFILLGLVICSLVLTACQHDLPLYEEVEIGESGTASRLGEQHEKKPVRMFNVDGELYYDSGLVSGETPRCGTLDGELKKAVKENEIPHKSGEANFEVEGYQNATSITKEVNVDGEWVIFRKYDTLGKSIDGLKYCYYIKGHLNNAAVDSEIIVLSQYEEITFNDVYEPLLSSQYPTDRSKGQVSHNRINTDEWGITLRTRDETAAGLTLIIEQFGGNPSGELQTGAAYLLETTIDDEWQAVETKTGEPLVWNDLAYMIKKNDITEMKINWQYAYGELKPGFYRLSKEVTDFRETGVYDEKVYQVHFSIG